MPDKDFTFLYETIQDYQETLDPSEKEEFLRSFFRALWSTPLPIKRYQKRLWYSVPKDQQDPFAQLFRQYCSIPYAAYRSKTQSPDSLFLLRQKINNLYTQLCDKNICTNKEYFHLLRVPKQLFYRYRKGNLRLSFEETEKEIERALSLAEEKRLQNQKEKMSLSWPEYQGWVEMFLQKAFDHYISLDSYCGTVNTEIDLSFWTEDNYALKYLSSCLNGYLRNLQKQYYQVKRNRTYIRCPSCGAGLIERDSRQRKCNQCRKTKLPSKTKVIYCVDCGKPWTISSKNHQTIRCASCYHKYRQQYKTKKEGERRKRKRMDSTNKKQKPNTSQSCAN